MARVDPWRDTSDGLEIDHSVNGDGFARGRDRDGDGMNIRMAPATRRIISIKLARGRNKDAGGAGYLWNDRVYAHTTNDDNRRDVNEAPVLGAHEGETRRTRDFTTRS